MINYLDRLRLIHHLDKSISGKVLKNLDFRYVSYKTLSLYDKSKNKYQSYWVYHKGKVIIKYYPLKKFVLIQFNVIKMLRKYNYPVTNMSDISLIDRKINKTLQGVFGHKYMARLPSHIWKWQLHEFELARDFSVPLCHKLHYLEAYSKLTGPRRYHYQIGTTSYYTTNQKIRDSCKFLKVYDKDHELAKKNKKLKRYSKILSCGRVYTLDPSKQIGIIRVEVTYRKDAIRSYFKGNSTLLDLLNHDVQQDILNNEFKLLGLERDVLEEDIFIKRTKALFSNKQQERVLELSLLQDKRSLSYKKRKASKLIDRLDHHNLSLVTSSHYCLKGLPLL